MAGHLINVVAREVLFAHVVGDCYLSNPVRPIQMLPKTITMFWMEGAAAVTSSSL